MSEAVLREVHEEAHFASEDDVLRLLKEGKIRNLGQGDSLDMDSESGEMWMLIDADGDEVVYVETIVRREWDSTTMSTDANLTEEELVWIDEYAVGSLWSSDAPKIEQPRERTCRVRKG